MMMRLSGLTAAVLVSTFATFVASSGCREETASRQPKSSAVAEQPTPEESFAILYETFRRGVATDESGAPSGFVASNEDGRSRLTVNNQVSHELIPPAAADEPYRAKITVVSVAKYWMTRESNEEEEEPEEEQEQSNGELGASPAGETVNILDPSLISTGDASADRSSQSNPVARRQDTDTRTFDLVYENGRWKLTEESEKGLNPKTEQAIISAFENAFRSQA